MTTVGRRLGGTPGGKRKDGPLPTKVLGPPTAGLRPSGTTLDVVSAPTSNTPTHATGPPRRLHRRKEILAHTLPGDQTGILGKSRPRWTQADPGCPPPGRPTQPRPPPMNQPRRAPTASFTVPYRLFYGTLPEGEAAPSRDSQTEDQTSRVETRSTTHPNQV